MRRGGFAASRYGQGRGMAGHHYAADRSIHCGPSTEAENRSTVLASRLPTDHPRFPIASV